MFVGRDLPAPARDKRFICLNNLNTVYKTVKR